MLEIYIYIYIKPDTKKVYTLLTIFSSSWIITSNIYIFIYAILLPSSVASSVSCFGKK